MKIVGDAFPALHSSRDLYDWPWNEEQVQLAKWFQAVSEESRLDTYDSEHEKEETKEAV